MAALSSGMYFCRCFVPRKLHVMYKYGLNAHMLVKLSSSKTENYYEILGVSNSATHTEIKQAHAARCKELHPDSNPTTPDCPNNKEKFILVTEAYSVLRDPERRKKYDRSIFVDPSFQNLHRTNYRTHTHSGAPNFRKHTHRDGFPRDLPSYKMKRKDRILYTRIVILSFLMFVWSLSLLDQRGIYNRHGVHGNRLQRDYTYYKLQEIDKNTSAIDINGNK